MRDDEKRKVQDDQKAKNILTSGLSSNEFFCIARCKNEKEIWNMLEVTHEGTMDVGRENLRQLCVFKVANETKKPWVWWDYVTDFQIRCPMKEKKYNKECANAVIKSLGK